MPESRIEPLKAPRSRTALPNGMASRNVPPVLVPSLISSDKWTSYRSYLCTNLSGQRLTTNRHRLTFSNGRRPARCGGFPLFTLTGSYPPPDPRSPGAVRDKAVLWRQIFCLSTSNKPSLFTCFLWQLTVLCVYRLQAATLSLRWFCRSHNLQEVH